MEDTNTNWTSIDLYYQGFHVKKSIPQNKSLVAIKETIDEAIKAGFDPSWNIATSKEHLGSLPASEATTEPSKAITRSCPHEGCTGTQTFRSGISKKTNKPYKVWFCDTVQEHADFVK